MCATNTEFGNSLYCDDPRHDSPCPQPCDACKDECDPKYLKTAKELEPV